MLPTYKFPENFTFKMAKRKIDIEEIRQLAEYENSDIENIFDGDSDLDFDHVSIHSHHSDIASENEINNVEIQEHSHDIITHPITKDASTWYRCYQLSEITPAHNIIRGSLSEVTLPLGVTIDSPVDAFNLIFSKDLISFVTKYTNMEGGRVYKKSNYKNPWRPVDEIEIEAFIGLLLTAGHLKSSDVCVDRLWSRRYGPPIFRATMAKNRFKEIIRFMRFDNKKTSLRRQETDKLACVREIWEKVNKNLGKYYTPGSNITVDEQMVGFDGNCPFRVRQSLPPKPAKHGMKIYWVNDSENGYPLFGIPYLGKERNEKANTFRENIVKKLTMPYHNTNRNVTFNRFFTSKQLALNLKSSGLTMIGELKKNKPYIPSNFQAHHSREEFSSVFGFTRTMTLVSYVPKKGEAEILLSSMHHDNELIENKRKPVIIADYNKTKNGTEHMNQSISTYTCKRKCNRWPMTFFMNLLDVAGFAGYIIYRKFDESRNERRNDVRNVFLEEMCEDLISDHIQRRFLDVKKKCIKQEIVAFEGLDEYADSNLPPAKKCRAQCHLCEKRRHIFQHCVRCHKNVCNDHSKLICNYCLNT